MNHNKIVTPSLQVDATLPNYINDNYSTFVDFMQKAAESEERQGFGQDILQNLLNYVKISTYKDKIVQYSRLNVSLDPSETDEIVLSSGFGFPEENGVVLIDDEVILYRTREENVLYGLQRGASGTTVLPTLRSKGTYLQTQAEEHLVGADVHNLSVLFLVVMLERLFESHAPVLDVDKIYDDLDRSILLGNIKDFFASKGSKLGLQAFFKIMFGEDNIQVTYPGDKMLKASASTWVESPVIRAQGWDKIISDPTKPFTTPDKLIGAEIVIKSLNDNDGHVYGRTIVDYVSSYYYEGEVQYEITLNENKLAGEFIANPSTYTTRELRTSGDNNDLVDTTTVTVNSTIGFPEKGIIVIGNEGIRYTHKTINQFLGCTRGAISVEQYHDSGTQVFGPFYLEGNITIDGVERTSNAWPLGLVTGVTVFDGGILNLPTDDLIVDGPGDNDPGEPAIAAIQENYDDHLMTQVNTMPNMADCTNFTYGPNGVYFNDDYVFVAASGFPAHRVGPFSTDNSVGPLMSGKDLIHTIPRRHKINFKPEIVRGGLGTGPIGMAVDGVPFWSPNSKEKLAVGKIVRIDVKNPGKGYILPTAVLSSGTATTYVNDDNGKILEVGIIDNANYNEIPTCRITTGEGFIGSLTFDNFGRISGITVVNGGQYYKYPPTLQVIDTSGRGRGALIAPFMGVRDEVIDAVVTSPGIDYNPDTTSVVAVTSGEGAELEVIVESFTYNRHHQIENSEVLQFDENNGHLFEDDNGDKNQYGYIGYPFPLAKSLGDDFTKHSPLLGFAYDGTPIYGPAGYKNGLNADDGIALQLSGYYLPNDRTNIIPSGADEPASLPPNITTYPMGTFIEDFIYDPDYVTISFAQGRIQAETGDDIQAQNTDHIRWQRELPYAPLDQFNGRICNTPEFPEELYPEGVYCYFLTTYDDTQITFPFVIGTDFNFDPISQNIVIYQDNTYQLSNKGYLPTYDRTKIAFDSNEVRRQRTPYLETTKDEVDLEIANVSNGNIDDIHIEDGKPGTTIIGDYLFFDNTGTGGGGASARISRLYLGDGTVNSIGGFPIRTRILSRRQLIIINENITSYTFPREAVCRTNKKTSFSVESYDYETGHLIVNVFNGPRIQFGDKIFDVRNQEYTVPISKFGNSYTLNDGIAGGQSTFLSLTTPSDDEQTVPGDLWWSTQTGRLYISYYDGDTTQWVAAQPSGMRPFVGASETGTGPTDPTTPAFSTPQADTFVSMSSVAPSSRADGSANNRGDLWWSTYTGNLYIWTTDRDNTYNYGDDNYTGEWVCTDPSAVVSQEGASDDYDIDGGTSGSTVFEGAVNVLISEVAPTTMSDGLTALVAGTLWWSPASGRMYIYYVDGDTSQWVVTNPSGSVSTSYSSDTLADTDGDVPDAIRILPETNYAIRLQVEDTKYFKAGDTVQLVTGAPGVNHLTEEVRIMEIDQENTIIVNRDWLVDGATGQLEIPDGTEVFNTERYILKFETPYETGLKVGDTAFIEWDFSTGGRYEEDQFYIDLSGAFEIIEVGNVVQATFTASVSGGEVTGVTIDTPGEGYEKDFYFDFIGGGGVGAKGLAHVAPDVLGGGVTSVTIISGGSGYTSTPTISHPNMNFANQFTVESDSLLEEETTANLHFYSNNLQGFVSKVDLISGGLDYSKVPQILGTTKSGGDNASLSVEIEGTQISAINVDFGGRRYSDPRCIVVDAEGAGSGCTTIVSHTNGKVTGVQVVSPGRDYRDPYAYIYDAGGKFFALTSNIGAITSVNVKDYGRNISTDRSLNPEIHPTIRIIVGNVIGGFFPNQEVFEGLITNKTAIGTVMSYDTKTQVLTLKEVDGKFDKGTKINTASGGSATVLVDNSPNLRVEVGTTVVPYGKFTSDLGKISSEDSALQDSNYYQVFSYEIESRLQQVEYDTFVTDTVHPAGFKMFSALRVGESLEFNLLVDDVTVTLE